MKDVARQHQLKIARNSLKMSETGAWLLGMTHDEARAILEDEKQRRAARNGDR